MPLDGSEASAPTVGQPGSDTAGAVVTPPTTPEGRTNPIRSVFSTARGLFGSPDEPTPGIQPLGPPVSDRPNLDIATAAPAPEPNPTGFSPQPADQPAPIVIPETAVSPAPEPTPAFGVDPIANPEPTAGASQATSLDTVVQSTTAPDSEPATSTGVGSPTIEGVSSSDLQASGVDAFRKLAGGATDPQATSLAENSEAENPEAIPQIVNDLRTAEGQPPLDAKVTGPDASILLQGYIDYVLTQGLTEKLSQLPETTRVNTLMAANRIAKAMGEKGGIELLPADVDAFLESARQKGIIPSAPQPKAEATSSDPAPASVVSAPESGPISPAPEPTSTEQPSNSGGTPPTSPLI